MPEIRWEPCEVLWDQDVAASAPDGWAQPRPAPAEPPPLLPAPARTADRVLAAVDGKLTWMFPGEMYARAGAPYGDTADGLARWWAEQQAAMAQMAADAERIEREKRERTRRAAARPHRKPKRRRRSDREPRDQERR
jgi:hypothetical protein